MILCTGLLRVWSERRVTKATAAAQPPLAPDLAFALALLSLGQAGEARRYAGRRSSDVVEGWRGRTRKLTESGLRNALRMRDRDLRARLEVGWDYVRPGGIRARDRRYVARFLELLEEYEEVQAQLSAIAPDKGGIEVLVWPDCGDWIFDGAWERRW
jgi:hypothetical protein